MISVGLQRSSTNCSYRPPPSGSLRTGPKSRARNLPRAGACRAEKQRNSARGSCLLCIQLQVMWIQSLELFDWSWAPPSSVLPSDSRSSRSTRSPGKVRHRLVCLVVLVNSNGTIATAIRDLDALKRRILRNQQRGQQIIEHEVGGVGGVIESVLPTARFRSRPRSMLGLCGAPSSLANVDRLSEFLVEHASVQF